MAPQPPPLLSSIEAQHLEATSQAFGLTIQELHDLKRHAVAAKATAYCPYSNFRVGAVLLTTAGAYIPGANVENAAYPVGTCAERVALGKAVTEGHRDFKAVAVATDISPPASPCGMCRQLWVLAKPLILRGGQVMCSRVKNCEADGVGCVAVSASFAIFRRLF